MIKTRPEAGATEALGTDEHLGFHLEIEQSDTTQASYLSTFWITMNGGEKKQIWSIKNFLTAFETLHIFSVQLSNKSNRNASNERAKNELPLIQHSKWLHTPSSF